MARNYFERGVFSNSTFFLPWDANCAFLCPRYANSTRVCNGLSCGFCVRSVDIWSTGFYIFDRLVTPGSSQS